MSECPSAGITYTYSSSPSHAAAQMQDFRDEIFENQLDEALESMSPEDIQKGMKLLQEHDAELYAPPSMPLLLSPCPLTALHCTACFIDPLFLRVL